MTAVQDLKVNCQTAYCVGESTMNNMIGEAYRPTTAVKRTEKAITLTTSLPSLKPNEGVNPFILLKVFS